MFKKIGLLIAAASFASQSWAGLDLSLDFTLDTVASQVSVSDVCAINCGLDASLASGFGGSFSLAEGQSHSFDFITWTGQGPGFFGGGAGLFSVDATLAFLTPTMATTTTSGGGLFLLGGTVGSTGLLLWHDLPNTVLLGDGSEISIDFQGGVGISGTNAITTTATVTVNSIGQPVSVPEPGMISLMALGLLGLGIARRQNA